MKNPVLIFIILLLMGAAFLIVGAFELSNRLNLMKNGLKAEGTVIDLKKHTTRRSVSYSPEIEFTTNTGQTVRLAYSIASNPPRYSIGQKVEVIYAGDNPKNFVIGSKPVIFGLPLIFLFVGAAIVALDIGIAVKKRKAVLPPTA